MKTGFINGLSQFIGASFHEKRGYALGVIVSSIVALPGSFLGGLLGWFLMRGLNAVHWDPTPFGVNPILWIGLMVGGSVASIVFQAGLYNIPVKYVAVLSFLGTRLYYEHILTEPNSMGSLVEKRGYQQKEGDVWYLPSWLGGSTSVLSQKTETLELGNSEILASDNVPVKVSADLVYKIENPYLFLDTADPIGKLRSEALDQLRFVVGQKPSTEVVEVNRQVQLSSWWLNGVPGSGSGDEGSIDPSSPDFVSDKKGLESEIAPWGLKATKAQIASIRLPDAIEKANAAKEVEKAQAISEMTEAENVAKLIGVYTALGLTPEQAANMVQTERGKASRIIISGNAPDIVQAGALAGGLVRPSAENAKPGAPFGGKNRRSEQR